MTYKLSVQQVRWIKLALFFLGLYPLARWFVLASYGGLTANPTEFLTRSSGLWGLVCLVVTLLITPLRDWFDQPVLIRVRRMCGLFAFFYVALHALAWAWWDRGLVASEMVSDVFTRPFVSVGMVCFLVLFAMALTSNQRAMRALGRRWKMLHRWVYLVAVLAVVHYWLHKAGKNDFSEVYVYGSIISVLLLWRVWRRFKPETKIAPGNHSG